MLALGALAQFATAQAGNQIHTAAIVEAATAVDTPSAISGLLCSVTEAATATDTPSNINLTLASITEAGTADDTPAGRSILLSGITEAGTADDSDSDTGTLLASVSEAGNADATQVVNFTNANLTEAAAASDTCDAEAWIVSSVRKKVSNTPQWRSLRG